MSQSRTFLKMKYLYQCYEQAQVDYAQAYLKLYISYTIWYREVTGAFNDRRALSHLKKRVALWDEYKKGQTMNELKRYMERLVELTQRQPLDPSGYWSGTIESLYDWRSLIEYWYRVRCLVVHGVQVDTHYLWLAFESLNIFMTEIIKRIKIYDFWQVDVHRAL